MEKAQADGAGESGNSIMLILIVAGVSLLRERPEGFAVALWTASPAPPDVT